ncbi:MAG TPA: hypothetical protein VGM90_32230 [Kofleriaceae bacterium]|jgi:hypothetical protein
MRCALALIPILTLAACGDDGNSCQAPVDETFDNGTCGTAVRLTGEFVDWDTDATFCGINAATLAATGTGGTSDGSNPNGRFDLCTPDAEQGTLTVTEPTAMSECTIPQSIYTTPTIVYYQQDVIKSGALYSARSITDARKATFFNDVVGVPFDGTKGQVFVHVVGTPRDITLDAGHAGVVAIKATAWEPGTSGHEVFFGNVEITPSGTAVIGTSGCAVGVGPVPVLAGTITNVTLNLL